MQALNLPRSDTPEGVSRFTYKVITDPTSMSTDTLTVEDAITLVRYYCEFDDERAEHVRNSLLQGLDVNIAMPGQEMGLFILCGIEQ